MTDPVRVRPAEERDVPSMLALMRSELGWPDDERAERLWHWKHDSNPFGRSPVWVAEVADEVVALRAFLRWDLQTADGSVVRAARAVDTATRADHRGRGLFRTLTLHGIEALGDVGVQFVFNTPNEQSRPGYLSMGWVDIGRCAVWVRPTRASSLFRMLRARMPAGLWPVPSSVGRPVSSLVGTACDEGDGADPGVQSECDCLRAAAAWRPQPGSVGTVRSQEYLLWRFGLPELGYRMVLGGTGDGAAVVRDRRRGSVVERSLLELLGSARSCSAALQSLGGVDHLVALGRRPGPGWIRVPATGPRLVARSVGTGVAPGQFDLSLGDVELL